MKQAIYILILASITLLGIVACTLQVKDNANSTINVTSNKTELPSATNPQANTSMQDSSQSLPFNQTALNELNRLNHLNSLGYLNQSDFSKIEKMFANDTYASGEITEIEALSKYHEYEHVFHGLSFLMDYVTTGYPVICPGHSISHYYVYMRHNETGFANDNLQDAEQNFERWIPMAKAYNEQYNVTADFNATVSRIQDDMMNIENGNSTATDDEIEWLATEGSICVDDKSK